MDGGITALTAEARRERRAQRMLRACARGDAGALEALYELVAPQLFGLLVRMLRRRALAEEALQDVFLAIWRGAGQYQPGRGSALAWVTCMARYRAIDLLRRERLAPVLMPEPPDIPAAEGEVVESPATSHALTRCLARLSDDQQRCLQFAYVGGRSHDEIAELTGKALGTVKSWIRRGLLSLRECLEA
jgi:RNA polymerase sigma-70 factor (ECF subfamily)